MMAARFLPFRLANRRNLAPRYVPFVWPAAWAHSTRIARSHLLPLPVRPLLRFPALSLFPGLTLAQEQRCLADNWLQVLGTAERSQVDQRVCHQLHAIM